MLSLDLIRQGALTAMLSGGVWWLLAMLDLSGVSEEESSWITILFIVALLLLLTGVVGFHTLQKEYYGRIGKVGFYTVIAAGIVILIPNLVFLLTGNSIEVLFPIALLGLVVGFVLYGIATFQAKVLPRWCGVVFITAFPVTAALEAYGNVWFGLVWFSLGYILWSRRDVAAKRALRIS